MISIGWKAPEKRAGVAKKAEGRGNEIVNCGRLQCSNIHSSCASVALASVSAVRELGLSSRPRIELCHYGKCEAWED